MNLRMKKKQAHCKINRVAVVYRAFLAHICREEGVVIDKDHLFSAKARVVVSSVDHVAALHVAFVAQPEVVLAYHDDGSIRMSDAECSVKILMSFREVFRIRGVVVVIHDEHDRVVRRQLIRYRLLGAGGAV